MLANMNRKNNFFHLRYTLLTSLRVLCLCLLIGFKADAQQAINPLPIAHSEKPVGLTCQYIVDSTDRLSIQQLTNRSIRWQSTTDPSLILGFTTHPVWCRFTVQQPTASPRNYAFELTNFYVDSLTLYQPDSLSGWWVQYTGDLIPFALRNPRTRYPALFVTLKGTNPKTFYARILSSQHHNYAWRAWDHATFTTDRLPDVERYILFTSVFMSMLFLLALLLFMRHFVVLRSYALWGLSVCISVLFGSGYSNILFPNSPYWAHTCHFVSVGLLLPSLAYYVVQACHIPRLLPRLVWLYIGFGSLGILYAGLSFFVRHPYITWTLIAALAIMMELSLALLIALYIRGIRPAIWNILSLLFLLPIFIYFYGRNAGFFPGSLKEESLKFLLFLSTVSEPFFVVMMLWQATRERIRTADHLNLEKSKRENIQTLDKLKTDFFTNVSHELRTPITLLLGPLQTLHSRFPDNELYAIMNRNAGRLQTLINQLLDLAKLDARQMQNVPAPGNLADDLRIWVALFDSLAQNRSVTLTLQQNQPSWPALYDSDKVEKILTNLLSNALKYTPVSGAVRVEALYTSMGVTIDVHNTGDGVAPEDLSHLFDRFYQGTGANRIEVGTGVGLALTYELVQLLGGTITVTSQHTEGTTFRVVLPIQSGTEQALPGRKSQLSHTSTRSPQLIDVNPFAEDSQVVITNSLYANGSDVQTDKPLLLLVEDNEDLRAYIRMILVPHFTLLEAIDGQQGLDIALDRLPELIVTDLMMPRLNGLDLCLALRADPRTDHIPIVMLTAKAAIEDRLSGLGTGADEYLTKPFLPAELLVRLQNLRRRQATLRNHWQRILAGPIPQPEPFRQGKPETVEPSISETPAFLKHLYAILEDHLDQPNFEVEELADALALSSRTLNRKLKALLDLNTRETIRNYRLKRGNEMLEQGVQPTQVAYAVGFGSLSSFGRAYKDQYGFAPSVRKR
jgi:signal transduction histidine kinase/CheY-like chemotaxis protein/AraC-like DNA-binding protein